MKKIVFIILLNCLLASSSNAQIRNYLMNEDDTVQMYHIDSMLANCLNNFQSSEDLVTCLKIHRRMWEDTLNASYNKLLAILDTTLQNRFMASQLSWKTDIENDEKLWDGIYAKNPNWYGEEASTSMLQYFLDRTRERALDMKYYLKDFMLRKKLKNIAPPRN
jgi:hypothetical protein